MLHRVLKRVAVVVALGFVTAGPTQAEITARPIPIDDFARVPNIQSVSLSAEGDMIVAMFGAPSTLENDEAMAIAAAIAKSAWFFTAVDNAASFPDACLARTTSVSTYSATGLRADSVSRSIC